jgi:DNA-binding beta-propeller fold protein YncE
MRSDFRRSHGPATAFQTAVVSVMVLAGSIGATLVASQPASAATLTSRQALSGAQAPVPSGATLIGPAVPSTTLPLEVTLEPRDPAALAAAVTAVSTPGSPEYHQFISPEQFAQLYGPTPATIAAVSSTLQSEGLTVGSVSGTDLYLPVTTTVAQAESTFATPIVAYRLPTGATGYDNQAAPSVPSAIAPDIQGILGLNTLDQPQPAGDLAPPPRPANVNPIGPVSALAAGQPTPTGATCTTDIDTVKTEYGSLDADDLAQAYSFGPLYNNNDYGAGATVALVEFEGAGYSPTDISTFAACYGITLGPSQISQELVDGATGAVGGATSEAELDIDTVLSMAPKANIDVYEGVSSLYDVFSQIVSDDTAKIVSVSWVSCEAYDGSAYQQEENTLLEEAALNGQTVFAAAGDQGAQGCNANAEYGVTTGSGASAQAVNSSTGTLYVANSVAGTLSVVNESTNVVVGTVTTQTTPDAVVYDAANSDVYVANSGSNSITEFSTTSCNATVVTGCATTSNYPSVTYLDEPVAMALDGTTLYVANTGSTKVAVFDVANNTYLGSGTLPSGAVATSVVVDSAHVVYVADDVNNAVEHFNGSTCSDTNQSGCATTATAITGLADPVSMVIEPTDSDVYVANHSGGIGVISTSTNTLVTTISTSTSPMFDGTGLVESIGLSPSGSQVLALADDSYEDVLITIVPSSQTVSGSVYFETGNDTLGQLVSDSSLGLVWGADPTIGADIFQNENEYVDDPAVQPDVTGVGGTRIGAIGPAPSESVWNDNNEEATGAGGGGVSRTFDMPTYQQALGEVTGSTGTPCANASGDCREVPDVSADADPFSGYVVYDSVNGYNWTAIGGTSAASPLWAAVLADVSSADGTTSVGYGSLNPALYSLAGASPGTYFNDVKTGNNDYSGTGSGQFPAMTGYDMATGLGTPIVSALATGLATTLPAIAVGATAISSTDVFVVGRSPQSALWYQQSSGSGATWSGWTALTTSDAASRPAVVMSGSNLFVFFRATDNELHYFERVGSTWGTEQDLGGLIAGNPAAAVDGNGRIIVATLNSAGNVFEISLPSGGSWSSWTSLAGVLASNLSLSSLGGNVYLLGLNGAGLGWTREWTAGATNTWGAWTSLGGVFADGTTFAGAAYGGTLHVQGINPQGILFETTGSGSTWSAWSSLDGILAATPTLAAPTTGLFMFDVNAPGLLWDQEDTTSWQGWNALSGVLEGSPVAVAAGANVFVFGLNDAGNLWLRQWNGTSFGAWTNLGGILATA